MFLEGERMKKVLFLLLIITFPLIAQDPKVVGKQQTFAQKLKEFNKVADYVRTSRECLSGIGCSKNQSYFANYSLGVAVGFARTIALLNIIQRNPELAGNLALVAIVSEELGYRDFVLQPVNLFRCLTFRGCDDQTKRYLFYRLGLESGGSFGNIAFRAAGGRIHEEYEEPEKTPESPFISIENDAIKNELGLNPDQFTFEWYEVLGFKTQPTRKAAASKFRKIAFKYHPDKIKNKPEEEQKVAIEVVKILSQAKSKGGL